MADDPGRDPVVETRMWMEGGLPDRALAARVPDAGRVVAERADIVLDCLPGSRDAARCRARDLLVLLPGATVAAVEWAPGRCVVAVRGGEPSDHHRATTREHAWRRYHSVGAGDDSPRALRRERTRSASRPPENS
ncbi:hypothetical protein B0I33_11491 [Prauserella shujinwangii]|uniref:Uncharacterized protein n=1 Tax=Prauserella shujinwangii TaxID=1453103 RepID=A0A2T0LKZ4_9PSEU|nr:hypothetical protein [Prauserella shujinwangii]PRX43630.1 hypothetical protein B0I33_11491 [Prauserella shujinwangii]